MQENKNHQETSIIATTKTSEKQEEIKDTCVFVMAEDGKWDITKKLYSKFKAVYDGSFGWYINKKYKLSVKEFCEENELICYNANIPDEYKIFKSKTSIGLLKSKLEDSERNIAILVEKLNFDNITSINSNSCEFLWSHKDNLLKYQDGRSLIKYLAIRKRCLESISRNEKEFHEVDTVDLDDSEFAHLLESDSEEKLIKELQSIVPGVQTGFKIGDRELTFPGGAISIIALPTSHGKTASLINFSLGALEESNEDLSIYFFSYEECAASIQMLFVNTAYGKKLNNGSNRSALEYYFKNNKDPKYVTKEKIADFIADKTLFLNKYINTGRLKVVYTDMTAEKLVESIKYIKQHKPKSMICIDYVQLLKLSENKKNGSRQEELKEICLMLKNCAVDTGLPIVVAAQFNRTVTTEADLSPLAIGEAGDLERIASLILGGFNRNFHLVSTGNIDKSGKKVEKENSIYWEILKGRGIGNGHNTIMDFDGNTGKLSNEENPF